ncbi:hypothetical protein [Hymenobacter rigui]|uniref:Uncharacterized protein n=1 Tax=Hymenobacter rigui TaxID=334424 RepID=A0A3R9V623_9BACT|nr:hypothetical protein [Hymenobacter rigui]RSK47586.1 hypothetical protein EI291_15120 [Hymenobacter rigui]
MNEFKIMLSLKAPKSHQPEQYEKISALQNLKKLEIRDPKLFNQILGNAKKLNALFSFCYKYKTGK